MNVLIYGGGAVGLGIASCLLKSNASVDIIAREDTVRQLTIKGLIRDGIFGNVTIPPQNFKAYEDISLVDTNRSFDFICVCTKSFDSETTARNLYEYKEIMAPDSVIILFQNGWGNTEKFLGYFSENQVYNARIITGFIRPAPHQVTITVHADSIHIGNLHSHTATGRIERLCTVINNGGVPCIPFQEIGKDLWAKMLYNCPLNPLGAILGIPYGKLAENAYTKEIMNTIIHEIFAVMTADNLSTHWENPEDFIALFYSQLVPRTSDHESSMLQDLRAGKRTEIDSLNGEIIRLGKKHNIPVNVNQTIWDLIKYEESK